MFFSMDVASKYLWPRTHKDFAAQSDAAAPARTVLPPEVMERIVGFAVAAEQDQGDDERTTSRVLEKTSASLFKMVESARATQASQKLVNLALRAPVSLDRFAHAEMFVERTRRTVCRARRLELVGPKQLELERVDQAELIDCYHTVLAASRSCIPSIVNKADVRIGMVLQGQLAIAALQASIAPSYFTLILHRMQHAGAMIERFGAFKALAQWPDAPMGPTIRAALYQLRWADAALLALRARHNVISMCHNDAVLSQAIQAELYGRRSAALLAHIGPVLHRVHTLSLIYNAVERQVDEYPLTLAASLQRRNLFAVSAGYDVSHLLSLTVHLPHSMTADLSALLVQTHQLEHLHISGLQMPDLVKLPMRSLHYLQHLHLGRRRVRNLDAFSHAQFSAYVADLPASLASLHIDAQRIDALLSLDQLPRLRHVEVFCERWRTQLYDASNKRIETWLTLPKAVDKLHVVFGAADAREVYPCLRSMLKGAPLFGVKKLTIESLSTFETGASGERIRARCPSDQLCDYDLLPGLRLDTASLPSLEHIRLVQHPPKSTQDTSQAWLTSMKLRRQALSNDLISYRRSLRHVLLLLQRNQEPIWTFVDATSDVEEVWPPTRVVFDPRNNPFVARASVNEQARAHPHEDHPAPAPLRSRIYRSRSRAL